MGRFGPVLGLATADFEAEIRCKNCCDGGNEISSDVVSVWPAEDLLMAHLCHRLSGRLRGQSIQTCHVDSSVFCHLFWHIGAEGHRQTPAVLYAGRPWFFDAIR